MLHNFILNLASIRFCGVVMNSKLWDQCTACNKVPVDVRTEIIRISTDGKITKMIVLRCEDHLDMSVTELLEVSKQTNELK